MTTTPLSREEVERIREVFEYQLRNTEKGESQQQKMNPEDRLREKETILRRLASYKDTLDTKMDARRRLDQNQTMEVVPAVDATWMQSSDDSFLRWEQDCDSTMRPSSQTTKQQDPEMAAIDRLMREYNLEKVEDPDETQLEDIEPPSGIWDTTVLAAKMNAASPVKAIRALRPSTIIEETMSSNMGNDSLASSYQTAASHYSKVAPSEQYQTATETICLSSSDQSSQSSNVIEILDDSLESRGKRESVTSAATVPANGTLDGISSLMPDEEGDSVSKDSGDFSLPESRDSLLEDTPDFNDTLERIEFMEQQGKRMLEEQKTAAKTGPSTPLLAKTLLPSASSKRVFYPSPSALNSQSPSSGTFKRPGAVRSPQVKFVPPKRNFDHIVSPIATYIKDVPTSTLYTRYKGQCLFSKNSPIKPKEDAKENKPGQLKAPQWNIPRKVFTATNNRHVSPGAQLR